MRGISIIIVEIYAMVINSLSHRETLVLQAHLDHEAQWELLESLDSHKDPR